MSISTGNFIANGRCGSKMLSHRTNTRQVTPPSTTTNIFESVFHNFSKPYERTLHPKSFGERRDILFLKSKSPSSTGSNCQSNFICHEDAYRQRVVSIAAAHAHPLVPHARHREIFLVLVTSSYMEIFMNFICHVKALKDMPTTTMFLVLTPHLDILEVAKGAGFGTLLLDFDDTHMSAIFSFSNMNELSTNGGADFGTILYQRMIFVRTYTALMLLKEGFNPVIVDIDTVWLQYPLNLPLLTVDGSRSPSVDVVVTYDEDEICGCFVYLNSTTEAINFWSAVVSEHRSLLEANGENNRNYTGHMSNFFDSEQKILTDFLLRGQYRPHDIDHANHQLKVYTHPKVYFLNGIDYFLSDFETMKRQIAEGSTPAVIHNNFIIGNSMKKNRFQRFGLWKVDNWKLNKMFDLNSEKAPSTWISDYVSKFSSLPHHLYCIVHSDSHNLQNGALLGTSTIIDDTSGILKSDATLQRWTKGGIVHSASRNTAIRSLIVILPLHNEVNHGSEYLKAMVMAEGIGRSRGMMFTNRNPPSYTEFANSFFVGEMSYDFHFATFTMVFPSAGFIDYVDVVGGNRKEKSVSIDTSYQSQKYSDERVRNSHTWVKEWDTQQQQQQQQQKEQEEERPGNSTPDFVHKTSQKFTFQLRVLTYNRPESLRRLLRSLERADYGIDNTVSLSILVDFPGQKASTDDVRLCCN